MQNNELQHILDFILSSFNWLLYAWCQLRTSLTLFCGKVLENCSELVGCEKTRCDKTRNKGKHSRTLASRIRRERGTTMFRVRKSMIQVGRLIVDFVNNELEMTLETQWEMVSFLSAWFRSSIRFWRIVSSSDCKVFS